MFPPVPARWFWWFRRSRAGIIIRKSVKAKAEPPQAGRGTKIIVVHRNFAAIATFHVRQVQCRFDIAARRGRGPAGPFPGFPRRRQARVAA